ncbi:metal-dependent hydrolase [Geodermatophilus sp. SYSU D01036]
MLRLAAPPLAVACILTLDLVASARPWPIPVIGLLDEPAHLLTAWLGLAAVGATRIVPWALVAAVAIDADHVPLYLWGAFTAAPGGRPVTHSLATVLVSTVVALAVPRWRAAAAGVAAGVLLHLARDVATGPGIPALWPFDDRSVLLPYEVHAGFIVIAALCAVIQNVRASLFPRERRPAS